MAPNFFFRHPDQKQLNAGNSRYDITDPEGYQSYLAGAGPAVQAHGGELLAAEPSTEVLEGPAPAVTVISLAFRLAFGSSEGTLTDEDVAPVRASIVDALATRFGAVLRA